MISCYQSFYIGREFNAIKQQSICSEYLFANKYSKTYSYIEIIYFAKMQTIDIN